MKKGLIILLLVTVMAETVSQSYITTPLNFFSTQDAELAPAIYRDGLVFISNRIPDGPRAFIDPDGKKFSDLYYVEKTDEREWGDPSLFSPKFTTISHDGPVAFAQDGYMICVVLPFVAETGERGRQSNPNSGLYFSFVSNYSDSTGTEWTDLIPFEHNDPDYVFYTPSMTPDGTELYFAANLPDTRGGMDIYVSRQEGGGWTVPKNLGDRINTPQDDLYPFYHSSGKLYFSSKGHNGSGDSDIFFSVNINGEWSQALSMGRPFNTSSDDYTLVMSDDYSEGYFTSKRNSNNQIAQIFYFSSNFPSFPNAKPVEKNGFCYRLFERSLDTIDFTIFDYEWVINDTLTIPGYEIVYCFPGPGDYKVKFNVTNKLTDTVMEDVANMRLQLDYIEQPVITCLDTAYVNQTVDFSAVDTYLPEMNIGLYYWDFGDGRKTTGSNASNIYAFPGTYRVVLGVEERTRRRRSEEPDRTARYKDIVILPEQ